jgi:hypothetical protein
MTTKTAQPHGPEHRRFRWTALWIGVVLIAILSVAVLVGSLFHDRNTARVVAIFAIGVVSFLGMLGIGQRGRASAGFEPGVIRAALATSFTMVFFAAVAIFLFSTNSVGDFGRTLMDNLTSLFGVVIGFYFASSAAVEYVKVKEGARTVAGAAKEPAPVAKEAPTVPDKALGSPNGQADLEAQVAALRAAVEDLSKKVGAGGGGLASG